MTLAGCASSGAIPADRKPGIAISRECERLAKKGEHPDLIEGEDPIVPLAKYAVELDAVNASIDASVTCQQRQRERLKGGRS